MKYAVVVFPGSNCDDDMVHVLSHVFDHDVVKVWHKDSALPDVDVVVLPGGFSYGDYLRTGAIARFSPIMKAVLDFAGKGGYVIGICNGFQILCEAGLLPGTLLRNVNQKFICSNTWIRPENTDTLLTAGLTLHKPLKLPIAHADGRFYADKEGLEAIEANDQVLFRYCDADGNVTAESNPNGALNNIAGVCNKNRNVFGMMPHPERASEAVLGNTDGAGILAAASMLQPG